MANAGKRPGIKQYPLRLPEGLFVAFAEAAKAEHRTINAQIALLIERWLAEGQKPPLTPTPRP